MSSQLSGAEQQLAGLVPEAGFGFDDVDMQFAVLPAPHSVTAATTKWHACRVGDADGQLSRHSRTLQDL